MSTNMPQPANLALVRALQEKITRHESPAARRGEVYSSGSDRLDRLLPGDGFCAGTLVQFLAGGSGAATLAMYAARCACAAGGQLVVIDRNRQFYPPAAAALGVDLGRLIVVHPENQQDQLWAWDQALRSRAVAAVWGWLGRIDGRWMRRWQLAAEQGGTLGLLVCPESVRGLPTWAEAQLLVTPVAECRTGLYPVGPDCKSGLREDGPSYRVELLRAHGGFAGGSCVLQLAATTGDLREISDEQANPLRVASQLADPAPPRSQARA